MSLLRKTGALLMLAVLFASCQMEMGAGVKLNRNGSGTFTLAVAADKEFIDGLARNGGGSTLGGFQQLFDSLKKSRWRVTTAGTAKGDKAFTGACDFANPRAIDRCLGQLSSSDGGAGNVRFKDAGLTFDAGVRDGFFKTHTFFAGSVNLSTPGRENDTKFIQQIQAIASQVFRFEIRAQLPGSPRIVAGAQAGKVEGSLVTWTPKVGERLDFRAESDAYNAPAIVALALPIVLLLGLGVWLLIRRRSPGPDAPSAENDPWETAPVPTETASTSGEVSS